MIPVGLGDSLVFFYFHKDKFREEVRSTCLSKTTVAKERWYGMLKAEEILKSVKEISDFLIETGNEELSIYLMQIMDNEPLKNYVNFNEAGLILAKLGKWGFAEKCIEIAEYEISLVSGCMWENNHYAFLRTAVEFIKSNNEECGKKPTLKDKYLYVLEFSNGTIKIGITKEKEKRMKAISSASGMDILRSYFTEKICNVQNLETELHKHFKDKRLNGEFFSITFEEAVAEVQKRTEYQN